MLNLKRRIHRLEKQTGMTQERYVLIITCADPEVPGYKALVYNGQLTAKEREELRAKYGEEWGAGHE